MTRARRGDDLRYGPLLLVAGAVLVLYFGRALCISLAFALTLSILRAAARHG